MKLELDDVIIPANELIWSYARSSGAGGQNVNKVSSKAILHWSVLETTALDPDVKMRFLQKFATRVNREGEVVISSERHRDQGRNAADCLTKLQAMVQQVLRPPKIRKATKPSRAAKRRRVESKRKRSENKKMRGRVDW
jgi:ribosome-associated protein